MKKLILTLVLTFLIFCAHAQAGISVSPGRLYYTLGLSNSATQYINVSNPNEKELEVGVSFNDWNYETSGINHIVAANSLPTSCVDWIQVLPGAHFMLKPGETKRVEVLLKVPENADTAIHVHNAMLFFTQLNPGHLKNENGASIQVTVKMGVKIYHTFAQKATPSVEIVDFKNYVDKQKNKFIVLTLASKSTIWADGKVKWELFNNTTGEKSTLRETDFYTLPNDIREIHQQLPSDLKKGKYTVFAQVSYGEMEVIKIAELEFEI